LISYSGQSCLTTTAYRPVNDL